MKKQNILRRGLIILFIFGIVGLIVFFLKPKDKKENIYNKREEHNYIESENSNIFSVSHPVVVSVRKQIGVTVGYDPSYKILEYPLGDVSIERGVCSDVVVRALREAYSMDLQMLVHEDMKVAFNEYPSDWGLRKPDKNIDHRRVLNLITYFNRKGYLVDENDDLVSYLPGDIITCIIPGNLPHIMIVSDRKTQLGVPLIIHNIGAGTKEEDRLFEFEITGHYRIKNY